MKLAAKPFVWLDATKISIDQLDQHFSNIIKNCIDRVGIDLRTELIPVMPIQHYSCGGILTDEFGMSTVDGLYAIGECASTGLHGANRLASNSLLEGICMAKFASEKINEKRPTETPSIDDSPTDLPKQLSLDVDQVKLILSEAAGVVRNKLSMINAVENLEQLKRNAASSLFGVTDFENTVTLELSILLLKDAISKEESIGVHYIEPTTVNR
jgi:L-aspartate oxidase